MEDRDSQLSTTFKGRSWTGHERSTDRGRTGKKPSCFGLEQGNRFVRRFRLLFRNGSTVSIPYAHLPIVLYDPDKALRIRTGDLEVTIKGRGLGRLAGHFNDEKVTWAGESPSATDTGDEEVFISEISMDGELLE